MIKLRMHSMYDHFPERKPIEGEPHIDCYNDNFVQECRREGKNIALLLEPRSMIGPAYDYVMEHSEFFSYIFTHDSELLKLPQARLFTWGSVWLQTNSEKTKGISLCTSRKDWCLLHHARLELADYYKDKPEVDVFYGEWKTPETPTVKPEEYLEHYKFSIIIENDIDELWFTEKILNCFATKTIPIYLGATKIDEIFDGRGIIHVKDWHEIPEIVNNIKDNLDWNYSLFRAAIDNNYKIVKAYKMNWKDRFFAQYEDLLEGML